MADAIFDREVYWFPSGRDDPRIIDGGANIGLATIYWKMVYPRARIVAFEPDPNVFAVLEANCAEHGVTDVELVCAALWTADGDIGFSAEGADAGRLDVTSSSTSVPTRRLAHLLDTPTDLLKLDIEGAETDVILDCTAQLEAVERIFCEFHSFADRDQRLDELLAALKQAGFRYHLEPEMVARRPFAYRPTHLAMDNQVNIYAFRT